MDLNELQNMRQSYEKFTLDEAETGDDPIQFFQTWFEIAKKEKVLEPNAMHLATVDGSGKPSGRVVLLKGIEQGNFLFFTNYESQKASDLIQNNQVALTFFWGELERQVRIEGKATKVSRAESEEYFSKRPRISQLGALVSKQSEVVPNRKFLEDKMDALEKELEGKSIPTPDSWGGYAILPSKIEFWQGRQGRLHDRVVFEKEGSTWKKYRLSP